MYISVVSASAPASPAQIANLCHPSFRRKLRVKVVQPTTGFAPTHPNQLRVVSMSAPDAGAFGQGDVSLRALASCAVKTSVTCALPRTSYTGPFPRPRFMCLRALSVTHSHLPDVDSLQFNNTTVSANAGARSLSLQRSECFPPSLFLASPSELLSVASNFTFPSRQSHGSLLGEGY